MNHVEFGKWTHTATDWGVDYRRSLRDMPVRAQTGPGDIAGQIAPTPPEGGEAMEAILADFERIIPPGLTHWQHPRFFAYFPANAAPASVIAEHLVSAIAARCMLWQTSPAATEPETCAADWLRQSLGLRQMIRNHVTWSEKLARRLAAENDFEIVSSPVLSLFSFRHRAPSDSDQHNIALVNAINDDGRIYLTQTRVDGKIAIRFQAGSFDMAEADADMAFDVITGIARSLT